MKKRLCGASLLVLASVACGSGAVFAQEGEPGLAAEPTAEELLLLPDGTMCDPELAAAEGLTCDTAAPLEGEVPVDPALTDVPDPAIIEQPEMNILVDQVPPEELPTDVPADAAASDEQPAELPLDQDLAQEPPMDAPVEFPDGEGVTVDSMPPVDEPAIDQALDEAVPLEGEQLLVPDSTVTDQQLPDMPVDQALPEDTLLPEGPVDQALPEDALLPETPVNQAVDVPLDEPMPEPGVDQATGAPLIDIPMDQALPEDELLPEPSLDQATIPEDQLLPEPPAAALLPEDQLLPEGQLLPEDQLLPEANVDQAAIPDAVVEGATAAAGANQLVDILGNPVDMTGQVIVTIQNVSSAELMILVDPVGGGEPVPVVVLEPGFQAVQPSPVGRTWRLAQNDAWVGAFVPTAEPRQLLRFTGQAPK